VLEFPRQHRDEASRLVGTVERQQLGQHRLQLRPPALDDGPQPPGILLEGRIDGGLVEEQVQAERAGSKDLFRVHCAVPPPLLLHPECPLIGSIHGEIDCCYVALVPRLAEAASCPCALP